MIVLIMSFLFEQLYITYKIEGKTLCSRGRENFDFL